MKTKVLIFGKEKDKVTDLVAESGFAVVAKNPDFVASFGGDGTVMHCEAKYPGIPKIVLRNSHVCKICSPFENAEVLQKIAAGKYKLEEFWKIEGKVVVKIGNKTVNKTNGKKLTALNDITIHNGDPRHAIRYKFFVNGKQIGGEIIGDGVVVATPFGSTGYYRSITDSFFEVGLGLAFNNSTEQADHMVLRENSKVEIEITRGPAVAFADNQEEKITLQIGDKITVEKSSEVARIVRPDAERPRPDVTVR